MDVTGVVLAAGAGERAGGAKALRTAPDGTPWLSIACEALRDAGCREVIVVLGAQAEEAATLVPRGTLPVVATDWHEGQSASLKVGLAAAATSSADAVLLTLVDLPGQTAAAGRRVMAVGADDPRGTLARAHYDGAPGHPVLLGRDHWTEIAQSAEGDRGAREYLRDHLVFEVDCSDLGGGADQDV
ncbi:NTP transferase domain-containing protein [Demequina sp. NBRC 110053]|uniref:nucleotidyltransferase family protein n=1 Tax=Demequina sp. NBRC 110053 TaxID=1570342 RepID=UPI000A055050|nr:NTP transferase domain-containing protein [Demequina sp. NBRC 110053]